ncbi:unnamed protein product [Fusarium graminearum]|uniref:RING-type domain-containing protein n=1 Tax=Gibberella zeae TaxID=5518 RepID=A0A9N8R7U1_GIBZA|nr:unnamed protein product [Fusarium graminearum]
MAGQNHVMSPFHQIVADSTRTEEEVFLPGRNDVACGFPFEELATREARRHSLSVSQIASLVQFQDLEYCSHVINELICSICLSPMLTPLLTTCGHTFCSECLRRHFTVTNQCPLDRRSIRPRKARRPQSMVDALDRLTVMCPNANQGCSSSINRDQVVTHILRCAYNARVSKDNTPDKDIESPAQDLKGNHSTLSSFDSSQYRVASQGDLFHPFNHGQMFAGQKTNMPPQQCHSYPQKQQQHH